MDAFPKSVVITDDTMREGLQIESASIPVEAKLRLLDALGETGAKVISIGSFAHPKWTPQMACIDEIAERFIPKPGVVYTAAVFNQQGFERADRYYPKLDVRTRRSRFVTHVELCDTFARRNYNRSQAQQIAALDTSVAAAQAAGASEATVSIGNPFGSNFEGPFSLSQRLSSARADDLQMASGGDRRQTRLAIGGHGLESAASHPRDDAGDPRAMA